MLVRASYLGGAASAVSRLARLSRAASGTPAPRSPPLTQSAAPALFCRTCGALDASLGADALQFSAICSGDFERFEGVDRAEFEAGARALAAQLHPDKLASIESARAARGTELFRKLQELRDAWLNPFSRGALLLRARYGEALAADGGPLNDPEFLADVIRVNELVAAADSDARCAALHERLGAELQALEAELRAQFRRLEAAQSHSERAAALAAIKNALMRSKFLRKIQKVCAEKRAAL